MTNTRCKAVLIVMAILTIVAGPATYAQTFTTLFTFDATNGEDARRLVQAPNGNFYGVTSWGGANDEAEGGAGLAFEIAPIGRESSIYNFCSLIKCADGAGPNGLVLAANGNFYGTAGSGGSSTSKSCDRGCGAFFKLTPGGIETPLYAFCAQKTGECPDGIGPSNLLQGFDGDFYGITYQGGSYAQCEYGCGTFFRLTATGTLTTLYSFCSSSSCAPIESQGPLVLGTDGNFYGIGIEDPDSSVFFVVTPSGALTTLYTFNNAVDGEDASSLIQGSDGNFYGTAFWGGVHKCFASGCGTLFRITPAGQFTVLHAFCAEPQCSDGRMPTSVIQGSDGNLYGVTVGAGANNNTICYYGCGTIFRYTPEGQLTTLYNFCAQSACSDGTAVYDPLTQGTDGVFYGTTTKGGDVGLCLQESNQGCGTIFSLSTGLAPFARLNPWFGKVADDIGIMGSHLKGSTAVSFNGTSATFTLVSDTYIKANVPEGATTGAITITTPSGTITSNTAFQVLP